MTARAARLIDHGRTEAAQCVTFVGAGPSAAGVLERLAENQAVLDARPLVVHLIDPYPPGSGHIWRDQQSGLLKLNSMAGDVTMFTDETATVDGPVAPGPDLAEWAAGVRNGDIAVDLGDELAAEAARLGPATFPTRRLHQRYLAWCLNRSIERLAPGSQVRWHTDEVARVEEGPGGAQIVVLRSGVELTTDLVIYSFGHLGSRPQGDAVRLAEFARASGATYFPPAFTADVNHDQIRPGEEVLVRGMGLAAIDLMVLLAVGRGGRFVRDGGLRYLPSGREPKLLIGSRRGVPYRSKIAQELRGQLYQPRYFTLAVAREIEARGSIDFRRDLWPVLRQEMLHAYYLELFTGSPARVRLGWEEFLARFDEADLESAAYADLIAEAVPDPADRLDLTQLDRPLAGVECADSAQLQAWMRDHLRTDLERRTDARFSENSALFLGMLRSFMALAELSASPAWQPESYRREFRGRWFKFFSYIASGPPGERVEELIALSEAGVVEFLGADLQVATDAETGEFVATTTTLPGERRARTLIDAWLPDPSIDDTDSAVLRDLIDSGAGRQKAAGTIPSGCLEVRDVDGRLIRADGTPHPRRYAVGPGTSGPQAGAFSRPRTNALSFRRWDAIARAVLTELAALREGDEPERAAS
ncbi:FAD/NAD(P)-binding protein [Parenemella sanctibonifatiensis]|uniref:Adenylate cyclase n=1 Tax=Parenemella sanctibonifatiensis TaxID=2016505 RepID=A0A255EDB0_9ACTN|nr:FAD/NAD(P)-binding protein [Parenemella sanctibonifatiensis]OYN89526.1 adenylate cyclase [Parenemella sanctibonifatiensis]